METATSLSSGTMPVPSDNIDPDGITAPSLIKYPTWNQIYPRQKSVMYAIPRNRGSGDGFKRAIAREAAASKLRTKQYKKLPSISKINEKEI